MDDALDSLDRIDPYHRSDRVKPSQQSSPDRQQKFAQELKDRMEEERRRQRQDEVIIEQGDPQASDDDDKQEAAEQAPPDDPPDADEENEKDNDQSNRSGPHIDVTA